MSRYRRWVHLDASGRVVREKLTASSLPPPWRALSQGEADAIMADPRGFRMRPDQSGFEKLPRIHLGGVRRFPADGTSTAVIVAKRFPPGITQIEAEVNGQTIRMGDRVPYQLGPVTQPGSWRVRVTDSRVLAEPAEIMVEAEELRD